MVQVLTAADVPGVNDAGVKHDEPLFPSEIMFYGHAVCWVLGETLEAARLGAAASRSRPSRCRRYVDARARRSPPAASRAPSRRWYAATSTQRWPRADRVFSGEFEFSGQEHFYLETHAALAHVDEAGQVFIQ